MHPQLNSEESHQGCADVMRALKACHSDNPFKQFLGACNDAKHQLNLCFRAERLERSRANLEEGKVKRKAVEAKWKAMEDEAR